MGDECNWEELGLKRARFEALAKLLRLRHHGQIEAPSRFNAAQFDIANNEVDSDLDTDSTKALPITAFDTGRLQRSFLDRLAELVANRKGGRHVAATMMTLGPGSVVVAVAKNDKFGRKDEEFLMELELLLRRIASAPNDGGIKDTLWSALLSHYESRIHTYVADVRQLLKRYQLLQIEKQSPTDSHLA
jgi:hypothetical protein